MLNAICHHLVKSFEELQWTKVNGVKLWEIFVKKQSQTVFYEISLLV